MMTWKFLQAILPTEWPRDSNRDLHTVTWPIHCQNYRRITNGYTDRMCPLVIPLVKANISLRCRPFPPLFLHLLPHPNSPLPNCKQPPPQKKKNLYPPLLNTSHLLVLLWSQHPCSDLLWILSFFVSKSIFFNFNI